MYETVVTILLTAAGTYLLILIIKQFSDREKKVQRRIAHHYGVKDDQFARVMESLLAPRFIGGNRVTPLTNGDEIFPAMLDAIRSAERTINFETYIYWSGRMAEEFADALAEKARNGVAVNVLLDWAGSKRTKQSLIDRMTDAGVIVERYHPFSLRNLRHVNHRTHRKILVVDGRIGFTGGVGIADVWTGDAEDPDHWRDTHYQVEGPAVAALQSTFLDNWLKTHADVLHDESYFPPLEPVGDMNCQVYKSSPYEGSESVRLMFLLSLAAAEERIVIASAYFVPDELSIKTLIEARRRGVKVEVILPGDHNDAWSVRHASRRCWGRLIEAGIEIHEYQPTMYHTKILIVDNRWICVGSTNFDNRSFRHNDEVTLNCLDEKLVRDQLQALEKDKERCVQISLEAWRNRPIKQKFLDAFADIFRFQL